MCVYWADDFFLLIKQAAEDLIKIIISGLWLARFERLSVKQCIVCCFVQTGMIKPGPQHPRCIFLKEPLSAVSAPGGRYDGGPMGVG